MKKLLFALIIFIFSFSNAKAVSNEIFDFNNSIDIGNYMANNYTRWICENYQCKKVNKKTDGDFATESECKKHCKSNTLNYSDNNLDLYNFSQIESNKNTDNKEYTSYTNLNLFDNIKTTTTQPVDYISGFKDWSTTKPNKDNTKYTNYISGFKDWSTTKPNKDNTNNSSIIGGFFNDILQGLGFNNPNLLKNNENQITDNILSNDEDFEIPSSHKWCGDDDYIWYGKDYGFRVRDESDGKIKSDQNWLLDLEIDVKIRKQAEEKDYPIGVLYSYLNENNERMFDSFDNYVLVPSKNKDDDKYYTYTFSKYLLLPGDVGIFNNKGSVEFIVVIDPKYYSYYKNKENDYEIWRKTEKFTISFDYECQNFSKDWLKTNCKFSITQPKLKSNFVDNKDPYYTDFKFEVKMTCPAVYQKFKTIPKKLKFRYTISCPDHFNTEKKHGNYEEWFFADKIRLFNFDISYEDLNNFALEKNFVLEDVPLLHNLFQPKASYMQYRPFNISKRCDINMYVADITDGEDDEWIISDFKDYFYLNQCKFRVVNNHPDWTYCTEDEDGNPLPINTKIVFDCERDFKYDINDIEFAIYPDPLAEKSGIYDSKYSHFYASSDNVIQEKNGQILHSNINIEYTTSLFDIYFTKGLKIEKNQAKHPTNLWFHPDAYFINGGMLYVFNDENAKDNQSFKVYYGSNYKCDNITISDKAPNPKPHPTIPPTTKDTSIEKEETIKTKNNIFNVISNFFKSLFK